MMALITRSGCPHCRDVDSMLTNPQRTWRMTKVNVVCTCMLHDDDDDDEENYWGNEVVFTS